MSSLEFTTLDVFTTKRFVGNPLAIVHVPTEAAQSLSQEEKQLIAREFNLSETVFLHERLPNTSHVFPLDIFTTFQELPFAGHPTIGAGSFLLSKYPDLATITLRTKAGDIPVIREGNGVKLQIPFDFKVHAPVPRSLFDWKSSQSLEAEDYVEGLDAPIPIASIVKGMTFFLPQLSSEDALARLSTFPNRPSLPKDYLAEWEGAKALYAFVEKEDGTFRTRMFESTWEDPATGSAASTLAGYLALKKGPGLWRFEITQGVEIGRKSEILVIADVGADGQIQGIELSGSAVKVMSGELEV